MSGGHFDYKQYHIDYIADEIEQIILNNDKNDVNEWGEPLYYKFSPEVINEFKNGLNILRRAAIYAQRIDWLVSYDDGEDSFFERLNEELASIKQI